MKFWSFTVCFSLLSVVNIISDFIYVTSVPIYNDAVQGILTVSVTLPFFINFVYAIIEANNKEETENDKSEWMVQFLKAFFAISTANLHLLPMQ